MSYIIYTTASANELHSHSKTKEGNLAFAYKYVNDAIAMAKQNNDIDNGAYFTGILAEVQEADNDFKNAYYNFKIYYETMDSVYSQETKNDIANLESQIEINKKNAQIASQNKLRIVLIIGLIMLSIIGILFYLQAKNRKLHNAKLSKLNEELNTANEIKAKLFGIISHDLRSPIANVVTLLQLKQNDGFDNKEDEYSFANGVLKDVENLLENMETLLLWSKGQLKNFSPNNKQIAVSTLFEHMVRFFRYERSIDIIFKMTIIQLVVSDELFLQVIMQNLTSNAIRALKSTSNPQITWKVIENENNISLKITDNIPECKCKIFMNIDYKKYSESKMGWDCRLYKT
ncbi:MAG: HAMP domain-containing histidine kinase [Bacteroidetes bacterium]|nr:HAMP domain-containing histidine kinase [Bacteroidota bacterium]